MIQHCDLHHLLKEPFDLECFVSGYCLTGDGVSVSVTMKVYDRRELCVWEGVTVLLSPDDTPQAESREENSTSSWQGMLYRAVAYSIGSVPTGAVQRFSQLMQLYSSLGYLEL